MTATAIGLTQERSRSHRLTAVATRLGVVAVATVAVAARIVNIRTSNDVFIDEVTYARLARSIAEGHGMALGSVPFDLHPAAGLAAYGLIDKLFGLPGGLLALLLDLRYAAAAFGVLACVGLYLLVRRAAPAPVALIAGVVLAIDPFAIRFDSRAMLEAPTQAAAVAAIGFLAAAIGVEDRRRRRALLGLAGLFSAVTICSKETFGLALIITLLALAALGMTHARRAIVGVISVAAVGWAVEVVAIGFSTGFSPWLHDQLGGVARVIGTSQKTGFNAPTTHVTLLSRVAANAGQEVTTYLLLFCGVLAAGRVLQVAWKARRSKADWTPLDRIGVLVAVWTLGGVVYLAYATLFGTIEEQMYYICLLPCVAMLALFVPPRLHRLGGAARTAAVILVSAVLVFDATAWVKVHTVPSTDYLQLVSWEKTHLPQGSVVATTETTAQFLLHGAVIGQWATVPAWRAHHVDYVVVSTELTAEGYALASPALLTTLQRHAPLVFSADDASVGRLEVFDVRAMDGQSHARPAATSRAQAGRPANGRDTKRPGR